MNLKGRLTIEQMKDLDGLILKLQSYNRCNLVDNDKPIDITDIRPLKGPENDRLWTYIRHICKMAVLNGKNFLSVQAICNRDRRLDVYDLVDEAVNDMCIHVYKYVWRHYNSSESEGYVYVSAYHGFKSWRDEINERMNSNDGNKRLFENYKSVLSCNHKVSNTRPS